MLAVRAALLVLFAAPLLGCIAALSPEDVASLHDAASLDLRIVERESDAGATSFNAQLARGALCSVQAVLRRADAGVIDSRGVRCEVTK